MFNLILFPSAFILLKVLHRFCLVLTPGISRRDRFVRHKRFSVGYAAPDDEDNADITYLPAEDPLIRALYAIQLVFSVVTLVFWSFHWCSHKLTRLSNLRIHPNLKVCERGRLALSVAFAN